MFNNSSNDDRALVVDCPVCYRTIWANSVCHHGQVVLQPVQVDPKTLHGAELVEPGDDLPRAKRTTRRDKGH